MNKKKVINAHNKILQQLVTLEKTAKSKEEKMCYAYVIEELIPGEMEWWANGRDVFMKHSRRAGLDIMKQLKQFNIK